MQAAIVSDKILFSIVVLRSAAGKASTATSSRAAKTHQAQVRICSQNSRGKPFGLKVGRNGEPISATIRTVWSVKKMDRHAKRATRRCGGIILRIRKSATIVRTKTRDKSMVEVLEGQRVRNCHRNMM